MIFGYREAERLRQATWIVKHPMDYTDRQVRRAAAVMREMESKREEQRAADRAAGKAEARASSR